MPFANYIADPYAFATYQHLSSGWIENYKVFKSRLNWLLLWNDEVHVFDSFFLFNREFEHWFLKNKENSASDVALRSLFNLGVIRPRVRQQFSSLFDTFDKHLLNNPEYRWRHDGPPDEKYVKWLDEYAGFTKGTAPQHYEGLNFPERFSSAFDAAFEEKGGFEDHYRRAAGLRDRCPPGLRDKLSSLIEGPWLRSKLYKVLGGGVRRDGSVDPRHKELADIPDAVIEELRKLIDQCWYITIDESLKVPARYPGSPPLHLIVPHTESISILKDDGAWENAALLDREIGSCFITGDLPILLKSVSELDLYELSRLRNLSTFKTFRQLYDDFEIRYRLNPEATLKDVKNLLEISKTAVGALKDLGKNCNVEITETSGSNILLRFIANSPVGRRLIAQGLVIKLLPPAAFSAPAATLADASLMWLTMHLQKVGLRDAPIHLHAEANPLGTLQH